MGCHPQCNIHLDVLRFTLYYILDVDMPSIDGVLLPSYINIYIIILTSECDQKKNLQVQQVIPNLPSQVQTWQKFISNVLQTEAYQIMSRRLDS